MTGDFLAFHIVIQLVKDFTSIGEISKRLQDGLAQTFMVHHSGDRLTFTIAITFDTDSLIVTLVFCQVLLFSHHQDGILICPVL